jgi:hypothetical protein
MDHGGQTDERCITILTLNHQTCQVAVKHVGNQYLKAATWHGLPLTATQRNG